MLRQSEPDPSHRTVPGIGNSLPADGYLEILL